jgi:pimeloyl-ACP methyl ester carboxylesterase
MARYPNYDPSAQYFDGWAADAFSKERAARWSNPAGGFMHAMHRHLWGDFHYQITGKSATGELEYVGGWQNNRQFGMHDKFRFVENIFEELDAPGEWYLDARTSTLYFYPPSGIDLAKATVEAVALRHLIEVRGTREKPVRGLRFDGVTFRHASRTFMENREPLLRSDWTIYRGGAVFLTGTEDVAIENATFDQVGGNAIFVSNYNRRVTVRGCHIDRAGANGIAFVGDPAAVRSPLFFGKGKDTQNISEIDRTPGPLTDNYPADSLVEECLIHATGRVEKQTSPIEISMSQGITVRHCSLYDVPRAAINISEGTWGGHVIEYCDVFDTVKETGDHGSFNSWGRDRYWGLKGIDLNALSTPEDRALPLLDAVKTTTLRNNRFRCDHGWDIDLDDGSSNYEIVNNLCLHGGLKLREGFARRVENNIIVGNTFHPHVWYKGSGDVFRRNIVSTEYKPIRVAPPWGAEIDFNLLHRPGVTVARPASTLQTLSGRDEHSLEADALFVDPAHGDYRVRDGSAALALGFRNFAMDQFGVTRPELRAIARTPELPGKDTPPAMTLESRRDRTPATWMGATVRNVVGMGEVSAAGLSGETGVLVLDVPVNTQAARLGLRRDDVVLAIDNTTVANTGALKPATRIKISRAQSELTLSLWQGFLRTDSDFAGRTLTIVAPATPADGKPWLWRGEFFGAFATVDEALLKLGWHVVYLACPNTFGSPETMERWSRLYDELTTRQGFSKRPVLLGMSRGGLYVYNWAALHPDTVGLIYGDAPVCDVKSWPGGKGTGKGSPRDWELFQKVYGFDEQQALAWRGNPIDILEPIAKAHIPVIHVVGDADDTVPVNENTAILKQRYEALGGHVEIISKPGVGHHPHSLEDPTPIVTYILENRIK